MVDWEKMRRDSTKHSTLVQSLEENASTKDRAIEEPKSREEGLSHFEKAKAHKSTLEAAVSEVVPWYKNWCLIESTHAH